MSDSFLDHLPSQEREKIRKRMRSPEAYERLRESVKGPEDLEREMEKNAESADFAFSLEADRKMQEKAKERVQTVLREQGIDSVLEHAPTGVLEAISKGMFDVKMDHSKKEPTLTVAIRSSQKLGSELSMGNIQEAIPLKASLQQQIISSLKGE